MKGKKKIFGLNYLEKKNATSIVGRKQVIIKTDAGNCYVATLGYGGHVYYDEVKCPG